MSDVLLVPGLWNSGPEHWQSHWERDRPGCATVAHWSATAGKLTRSKVRALLVAPSDVEAPNYPKGTEGFRPMPLERLPFPTIVVASRGWKGWRCSRRSSETRSVTLVATS